MSVACDVYTKLLFELGHGYPLWEPEPVTQSGEVLIGDVGYILDGGFYRLFNATLPSDHPFHHRHGVPDGHEVFQCPDTLRYLRPHALEAGAICSESVTAVTTDVTMGAGAGNVGALAGIHFKFTDEQGAILVLKNDAHREVLHPSPDLTQYILRNHAGWHEFARNVFRLDLKPQDIIFVSGWVKTSQWALGAATHSARDGEISFGGEFAPAAQASFSVSVTQKASMPWVHRQGPKGGVNGEAGEPSAFDQCIFLHYYKVKHRLILAPKVIRAAAEEHDSSRSSTPDELDSMTCTSDGDESVTVDVVPRPSYQRDMVDEILDYIFDQTDATCAIVSDRDLVGFSSDHQEGISDNFAQLSLIDTRPNIIVAGGVGMLSRHHASLDGTTDESNTLATSSPNAFDHASPTSGDGPGDDVRSHVSFGSSYDPTSPRPDISQTFQDLSLRSPPRPQDSLPDDRRSPPLYKPQLLDGDGHSPPTINAPDGDGSFISRATSQIVPAAPISRGGVTALNVPFQDNIAGPSSNPASSGVQEWARYQQCGAQDGQFVDQPFSFSPGSGQYQCEFLLPGSQAVQRSQSMSYSFLRPPVWDTDQRQGGTVNMNEVLPGPGQGSASDPLLAQHRNSFRHPSSAGPYQMSFGNQASFPNQFPSDYLTVDAPGGIRRVRSDGGQLGTRQRQARSLDIRLTNPMLPNNLLLPPPGPAQQDFLQRQFSRPSEPVTSISRGHHRRSSSGERERGIGGLGVGGMGMGGEMAAGWTGSSASSARASPYPSPSASPRPGYGPLPQDVPLPGLTGPGIGGMGMSMNMGMPGSLSSQMGLTNPTMGQSMDRQITVMRRQGVLQADVPGTEGSTTPSTAKRSHDRRKQPANFPCPVPGCESTFTRHFNLKGHLRSHAEEKPYQCKWPGCGKGFARLHDCKMHEQLHLNIRPYPCEGCKKNFARMDELNRHLRSEGGAECRKIQEELNPGSMAHLDVLGTAASSESASESKSATPSVT